jgi:hypothetical protein
MILGVLMPALIVFPKVWILQSTVKFGRFSLTYLLLLLFLHRYALGRAGPSAIYYTGKPHPCGPDEKPVSEIKETISY